MPTHRAGWSQAAKVCGTEIQCLKMYALYQGQSVDSNRIRANKAANVPEKWCMQIHSRRTVADTRWFEDHQHLYSALLDESPQLEPQCGVQRQSFGSILCAKWKVRYYRQSAGNWWYSLSSHCTYLCGRNGQISESQDRVCGHPQTHPRRGWKNDKGTSGKSQTERISAKTAKLSAENSG